MIRKLGALIFLGLVWYLMFITLNTPAIPNPIETINYTVQHLGEFLPHLSKSLTRIGFALVLAAFIGVSLGVVMGTSSFINKMLSPLVYILYPLPKIAFLPILMLLFGLGETPKVMLIFSVIVFQFILGTMDAIIAIDDAYFNSVKALGLKGWSVYKECIFPAILPNIITSIRISFGVSIAILFFAETFSTKLGIGYYIMNSYAMVNYQSMYAGIIILSVLGLIIYEFIDWLEQKLCPWLF